MIKSTLKPFAEPESSFAIRPGPTYPYIWIDKWSTVWLRTCASCAVGSRDVCLRSGKGGPNFTIGDITETVTPDINAWPMRMVEPHVLELSNF